MSQLLDSLIEFYKEDSKDPFNVYALAIEYSKTNLDYARKYFEELLVIHPEYIATYYHAAALYLQLNEIKLAKNTYLKGIKMAERFNKSHALKELKSAYQAFLDEIDE